jgi:hypothetical protein
VTAYRKMIPGLALLAAAGVLVLFGPRWCRQAAKVVQPVTHEVVASLSDVTHFTGDGAPPWPIVISPDFNRVAIVRSGKSSTGGGLYIDGKRQWPFGSLYSGTLVWSPDSRTLAGSNPGILYVGQQQYAIKTQTAPPVKFSQDGKRWMAVLDYGGDPTNPSLLVDGQPHTIEAPMSAAFFLGPENRLAYLTKDELVIEGGQRRPHPAPGVSHAYATADGNLLLLIDAPGTAHRDESRAAVVSLADGKTQEFKGAHEPSVSPDGTRLVFKLARDGKIHVVIDGVVGPGFGAVTRIVYAPDGHTVIAGGFNGAMTQPGEFQQTLLVDNAVFRQANGPLPELISINPAVEVKRERGGKRTVAVGERTLGPYDALIGSRTSGSYKLVHVAGDGSVTFYAVQGSQLLRVAVR